MDFKLRYYESFLGLFWALINPLFRLAIYYFVFSFLRAMKVPNYGLYIFSGLIIWLYFQETTKQGIQVIKSKRYLLENINFNKLDLFMSSVLSSGMGLLFNISIYLVVSIIVGIYPGWNSLYFLVLLFNLFLLVFSISLILSTIHIFMRDIRQVWDMILVALFWLNPIFFAKSALIFEKVPSLLYINPLAGIIINTRNVLLYNQPPDWGILFFDLGYALMLLFIGMFVFKYFFNKAAEKF